jgi:hypothetical protein
MYSALAGLLKILRRDNRHPELPKDPHTLTYRGDSSETYSAVEVKNIAGGICYQCGIEQSVLQMNNEMQLGQRTSN